MRILFFDLYSDPVALLKRAATDRGLWRRLWLQALIGFLCLLAILAIIALLSGMPTLFLIAYALIPIAFLMLGISVAVTTTHHALLWLLYLGTPITLLTALASGIGLLWPGGWMLSGALGTPLLLGLLISATCAVDIYNRTEHLTREQTRGRQGGPYVDPALPSYQNRARLIRLGFAIGAVMLACVGSILLWPADSRIAPLFGLALLVFAGATLRVEATLRCLIGTPLVRTDDQGSWHTTYAGRWALFVPTAALRTLLIDDQTPSQSGAALIALFRDSCLAPPMRRSVGRLTPAQAARVALALSLQPGGASAIRYLAPKLTQDAREIALTYADLAAEAAHPADLRRWLEALNKHPNEGERALSGSTPDLARALVMARAALRCYTYDPVIEAAANCLHQVFPALYGDTLTTATPDDGWPVALRERIIAHGNTLRTAEQGTYL